MDSKGRWCDNVFVERFWRSIKHEEVYLLTYDSVNEARSRIGKYIQFFNSRRPHSTCRPKRWIKYTSTDRRSNGGHNAPRKQTVEMMEIKNRAPHYHRLDDYKNGSST